MTKNAQTRLAVLRTLYAAREAAPKDGWLSDYDLKQAHGPADFALAVLEELGQLKRDGYRYRITGAGVLACEASAD